MKIYYDKDADLQLIRGKKVAVIGLWEPRPCAFAQSQRKRRQCRGGLA